MENESYHSHRLVIIIIIIMSVFLAAFAFYPTLKAVPSLIDDAYYYLQISRDIALGQGSTFDGINKTNGYHPLWLIILIPVHFITGFSRIASVRAVFIIQSLLYFFTLLIILRRLKNEVNLLGILSIVALSLYPKFFHIISVGMEAMLVIFLITCIWSFSFEFFKKTLNLRDSTIMGVFVGFLILARIDIGFVFLFITPLLVILVKYREGKSLILYVICMILFSLVIISPFFIWNYVEFGHFLTISSLLKSSFPRINFSYLTLLYFFEYYVGIILFLIILFLKRRSLSNLLPPYILIGVSSFIGTLVSLFLSKWGLTSHHFAHTILPMFITGIFFFDYIYKKIVKYKQLILKVIFVSLFIVFYCFSLYLIYDDLLKNYGVIIYKGAIWAKENTNKDDIFGLKDSGIFGYFSERRTINLDGKVNNFVYQEFLREKKIKEYLRINGVDYMVQVLIHPGNREYDIYTILFPSLLYMGNVDSLDMKREDEVYRLPEYSSKIDNTPLFIIWKFNSY